MIYFNVKEIIASVAAFFIFGVISGVIYPSLEIILKFLVGFIKTPFNIIRCFFNKRIINNPQSNGFIIKHLYDFIFVISEGILFIIINYIFLDGAIRFYSVLFVISGLLIGKNTIGTLFNKILSILFKHTEIIVALLYKIMLYPICYFLKFIGMCVKPIVIKIKIARQNYKTKKIFLKKEAEITAFFEKIKISK